VSLIERLIGRGYQVTIYDSHVSRARLIGANKEYIEREVPHIWSLMRPSVADVVAASDTLIIGNGSPEFRSLPRELSDGQIVVDLVRAFGRERRSGAGYEGICW
jgi:GDP-mannose 6-dehydrogenase